MTPPHEAISFAPRQRQQVNSQASQLERPQNILAIQESTMKSHLGLPTLLIAMTSLFCADFSVRMNR